MLVNVVWIQWNPIPIWWNPNLINGDIVETGPRREILRTNGEQRRQNMKTIYAFHQLWFLIGVYYVPIPLSWSMHSLDFCHSCILAAHFLVVRNLESLWTRSLPQIIRCQSADHSVSDVHAIRNIPITALDNWDNKLNVTFSSLPMHGSETSV